MSASDESLASKLAIVFAHLNERQCRIVAAAEARAMGRGGIARVAEATGMSRSTVQKAVAELDEGWDVSERVRRPGAGRKSIRRSNPRLVKDLEALVDPATRGDPESPLRWTSKSTRQLADALVQKGYEISDDSVGNLLHALGYSLQASVKTLEGASHPDRNAQFSYINDQVNAHIDKRQPVISVDTKKKELIGNFRTPVGSGSQRARRPRSTCTTSSIKTRAKQSPTGSTMWPQTPGGCRSGAITIPRRTPSRPSEDGGAGWESAPTPRPSGC